MARLDVPALQRWLVTPSSTASGDGELSPLAGSAEPDDTRFASALAAALVAHGLPISRMSYALMTMHPEVLWRTVQWQSATGQVVTRDQPHARLEDAFYTKSAVAAARRTRIRVHVPLVAGPLPYPLCEELRDAGATDYTVEPLRFGNGQTGYVSFATTEPGGFSAEVLAAFTEIGPYLAQRLELESSYYATRALLDVYLGRNASRRVLAGAFQRGGGELIDAAIWFSDLRDFTALSDRSTPAQVIEALDGYFDAAASSISAGGGEVLKFIGDAVLAIFPLGDDAAGACRRALEAAEAAFVALAAFNETRAAAAQPPLKVGVALHRGQVMYGNIGARDRLDFTVISAAVNEASRLESLCKTLDTDLALSETFAHTAGAAELIDLGAHPLKGVAAPLHVFTTAAHAKR